MFPGYVLIKTEMTATIYRKIISIPESIRVLNNGNYYSKIDEEQITPILKLMGDEGVVSYSQIYIENSTVFVKSGPLKGLEGMICKIDRRKGRAKVLINFMNSYKTIDVGIEFLSDPF
jgi:transcriptional antiterminator NusG